MVKKGQIKIQQMVFMIIAVFILFVLIGLIAMSSRLSKLKGTVNDLKEKEALEIVSKLANSPEFSCANSYGSQKSDCVDFDKLIILKENIDNYKNFWGVSNIEVRKMPNSDIACTSENYPECDTIKIIDGGTGYSVSNFVSVCYKELNGEIASNKCEIGKLIVSYEEMQ